MKPTPLRSLNLYDPQYTRAGILPITTSLQDPDPLYWFALDSDGYQITDFGGGRDPLDRDILDTAIREYEEESFNLLPSLNRKDAHYLEALVSRNNLLILYPTQISQPSNYYMNKAQDLVGDNPYFETQALIPLKRQEMKKVWRLFNPHLASLLDKWGLLL